MARTRHVCRIGDIAWAEDAPPALDDPQCGARQVEPWLSAILQAEHLSLLVGNGLTTAVVNLAGGEPVTMTGELNLAGGLKTRLESEASAQACEAGRQEPNIEDRLRVGLAMEHGLRLLADERAAGVRTAIDVALEQLCEAVLSAEREATREMGRRGSASHRYTPMGYLVAFILAYASRTPTRDRLHIFTTNYDRLIEHACDRAGLRVLDRFVGTLRPRFRSSRLEVDYHYSPPGLRGEPRFLEGVLRLTKLHGSIDWRTDDGAVLRDHVGFGDIAASSDVAGSSLLVFPQSAKDLETAFFPYADLFRDFSAAICRPNSVLVTYGYGFGDDHVNRVIGDMLSLPSTHLVVFSWDDAQGRIEKFLESNHAGPQSSEFIGPHFGDLRLLVDHYLPRPAIDDMTWRRARLLRVRAAPSGEPFSDAIDDVDA